MLARVEDAVEGKRVDDRPCCQALVVSSLLVEPSPGFASNTLTQIDIEAICHRVTMGLHANDVQIIWVALKPPPASNFPRHLNEVKHTAGLLDAGQLGKDAPAATLKWQMVIGPHLCGVLLPLWVESIVAVGLSHKTTCAGTLWSACNMQTLFDCAMSIQCTLTTTTKTFDFCLLDICMLLMIFFCACAGMQLY